MSSSFKENNLNSLFSNAAELKEISTFLKSSLKTYDDKQEVSEMDKILQDIGYFSIITKDTSGINYFDELAK